VSFCPRSALGYPVKDLENSAVLKVIGSLSAVNINTVSNGSFFNCYNTTPAKTTMFILKTIFENSLQHVLTWKVISRKRWCKIYTALVLFEIGVFFTKYLSKLSPALFVILHNLLLITF